MKKLLLLSLLMFVSSTAIIVAADHDNAVIHDDYDYETNVVLRSLKLGSDTEENMLFTQKLFEIIKVGRHKISNAYHSSAHLFYRVDNLRRNGDLALGNAEFYVCVCKSQRSDNRHIGPTREYVIHFPTRYGESRMEIEKVGRVAQDYLSAYDEVRVQLNSLIKTHPRAIEENLGIVVDFDLQAIARRKTT